MVEVNGVDLHLHGLEAAAPGDPAGAGILAPNEQLPAAVFLHQTGETGASWSAVAAALAGRVDAIVYDRRGWGESGAPEPYTATTISEQARDAIGVLDHLAVERAVFCGCGIGALAALDAAVHDPTRVRAVVAVEPPFLFMLPELTEGMSADMESLTEAAERGGMAAAAELHASGGLPVLGPGADRYADRLGPPARPGTASPAVSRPFSLFAEISAVSAWGVRLADLDRLEVPVAFVTGTDSPEVLRRAADAAAARLTGVRRVELTGDPIADPALADLIAEFAAPTADPATTPADPATTPADPATTPADPATTPAGPATTPADSGEVS